jgi:Mg2+ and Co2+ transporter CorA
MSGGRQENSGVNAQSLEEKMNDKVFEVSLTTLAILVLAFIVAAIVLDIVGVPFLQIGWAIFFGLLVLILGGGTLLYFWGKNYMART